MPIPKLYLGDSVYAQEGDHGEIILTTENGLPTDPSNRIIMEPEVIGNFSLFLRRMITEDQGE